MTEEIKENQCVESEKEPICEDFLIDESTEPLDNEIELITPEGFKVSVRSNELFFDELKVQALEILETIANEGK